MLNQISIEYPQNLPDILHVTRKSFEEEAKMAMAVKLFEMKQKSLLLIQDPYLHY